jgi:putative sigma-54 modulation protein
MRLQIRGRNMRVGRQLRNQLEKRLQFALGRLAPRVSRVCVDLEHINGHRGGADKSCRIAVHLNRGRTLRMGLTGNELIPLVDCAADRIGRVMRRALQRRRDQRRQRPPHDGSTKKVDYTA